MKCGMFEHFLEENNFRYKLNGFGYEIVVPAGEGSTAVWTMREVVYLSGRLVQPVWERYHNKTIKKVSELLNGRALLLEKIPIALDSLKEETLIYRFLCWRLERGI
jgi:hypothetical protein